MDALGYTVLGAYLLVLILIGYLCSGKQQSLSDFFLAGHSIPAWAALAAVVATETSAVTYIGAPTMSFNQGGDFAFLQLALGFIIARVLLSFYFLPRFFEHRLVTIYQFLGIRFGVSTQRVSGFFFFVTRALAAGVRHYAAALVISSVTRLDLLTAIWITGIVSLLYSILGGLSAVIWTEVVQFVIMIVGSLLAFYYLLNLIPGGWNEVLRVGIEHDKFRMIHWDWAEGGTYTFFIGILAGTCLSLATHGADQDLMQRLLSCRGLGGAQIAMTGSGIFVFIQFAFFLLIGVMLFAYYGGQLPEGIEKADQLFPYFVATNLPSAAGALVIAAILSAALSSTASALNSLSSTSMNDFYIALSKKPLEGKQLVFLSRCFTLFWTLVLIGIAMLARNSESILNTGLSIPSYTYGSLLAAFLLGIFTPIQKSTAVISGMFIGVAVVLLLAYFRIPWTWFIPAGTLAAMLSAASLHFLMHPRSQV